MNHICIVYIDVLYFCNIIHIMFGEKIFCHIFFIWFIFPGIIQLFRIVFLFYCIGLRCFFVIFLHSSSLLSCVMLCLFISTFYLFLLILLLCLVLKHCFMSLSLVVLPFLFVLFCFFSFLTSHQIYKKNKGRFITHLIYIQKLIHKTSKWATTFVIQISYQICIATIQNISI